MSSTPAFAQPSDLAEWLGETITAGSVEEKRAVRCLRLASNLIRRFTGKDWLNPVNPSALMENLPDELEDITCAAAGRFYTNPEGKTSYNQQVDDALDGGSYKVEEAGVYLTASEKTTLMSLIAADAPTIGGIGVIHTTRGEAPSLDMNRYYFDDDSDGYLHAVVNDS